ncbi:MerR family transcriptional regulator [Prescottella sp. R16]|uniref:MerR family transcriptional regulator n=1 Tax=Prescottella sp. R16 TaxID=3064529 RepID=UPI00272E8D4A|nr:MerR family transcriptional regulator [Prescottella sp. R16]
MPDDLFSISDVAHAFGLSVPALRYYEERGLIEASERRGRVRYFSRDDLCRLAYVQLWHEDGMLSLADTQAIVESDTVTDRSRLIEDQAARMRERIGNLSRAVAVLEHMLGCRTDRARDCPMTGTYIRARVDAALSGEDFADDFLPKAVEP